MRTRLQVLTAVLALAAIGAPAWAAAPFGHFGGKVGGGNAGSGLLPVHGWALDDDGVQRVEIVAAACAPPVDGNCNRGATFILGTAEYGRSRPAVTDAFPGYPDSGAPGFAFQIDTPQLFNGKYWISARIVSDSGEVKVLKGKLIQIVNNDSIVGPSGKIEFPPAGQEMRGNCNLLDAARRYSVVSGYAIDTGMTKEDSGIGWVELLIDRATFANTETDCRFLPATGGPTDCYGIRRQDLVRFFPILKDTPHVGYRFIIDVGALLADPDGSGPMSALYPPGHHLLTVRAGDNADEIRNIAEIHVTFACDEFYANEDSFGDIVLAKPVLQQAGSVLFSGWALDWEGVHHVEIWIDGYYDSDASFGLHVPNIDLLSLFPGYPDALLPGWVARVDTTELSNGKHELEVHVIDDTGAVTYIGKREFVVANP